MAACLGASGHTVSLLAVTVVLVLECSTGGAAQRVFLTSNNPTPCYNNTVDLICYYPDVTERVNGQPRYSVTIPSWRVNGKVIFPDEDVFSRKPINQTASRLIVRIDPANFTGDPVSFTCYLPLTSGGEDSASTVVDPQEVAKKPTLLGSLIDGRHWITAIVMWDHTDRGPCFNHLTFSYNITWYPVVGGVSQRGEGQSGVTGPGATEYIITNLMNDTDYRVELFGFTPCEPVVYSEVATVDFTTTGVFDPHVPAVAIAPSNPTVSQEVFTGCLIALYIVSMTIFGGITAVLCWKIHTLKQKGLHSSTCDADNIQLPPNPGDPTSSGDPTLFGDPTPSGDPTLFGDPAPFGDATSVQLQPNPSYCLLEMSHQQLMSSQLENEAKYVNL